MAPVHTGKTAVRRVISTDENEKAGSITFTSSLAAYRKVDEYDRKGSALAARSDEVNLLLCPSGKCDLPQASIGGMKSHRARRVRTFTPLRKACDAVLKHDHHQ